MQGLALAPSNGDSATYQVMPALSEDDYASLKADIGLRGVLVPVEYDEHGNILDGHHRVQICGELGITEWPRFVRSGLTEEEKRQHARQLNLARRHLDRAQKRELIVAQLKETPEKSNRQIAAALGVNHETVQAVRTEGEGRGEIRHVSERKDTLGRHQPSHKPASVSVADADEEDDEPFSDILLAVEDAGTILAKGTPEQIAALDRGEISSRDVVKQIEEAGAGRANGGANDAPQGTPAKSSGAASPTMVGRLPTAGNAKPAPEIIVIGPEQPEGFNESIHVLGYGDRLAEVIGEHRPRFIAGGVKNHNLERAIELSGRLSRWMAEFNTILKERQK